MAKKRANGEGSIRKRSDGRWEGRYTAGYNDKTGKRIIKNVLGKTQAECKAKLKKAIEESQTLDVSRANEYTVSTWLRTWFELYAKPHIRPSTMNYYPRNIEQHVVPAIGDIPLNRLAARDLQKLYNDLQSNGRLRKVQQKKKPGLSNSTVRGIHMMLHNALDRAVKEKLILSNPTENCIIPKLEKQEMKILHPDHISAYLDAAERRNALPMFYLELVSGLRKGELVALQWSDLDEANGTISVSKQASWDSEHRLILSRPKTGNSIREVSIPQNAVELLKQEHAKHPGNPWMFPSGRTGEMYHPDSIVTLHKRILKDAGLEHIRFHDLRHPYVKPTTKIFSLRLMDFQAQAYDGLHQSALCRARADWLVGINATRLFSVLYHRTLNVGRVMTPTLALIVQREAEIGAFRPETFYIVNLRCGGFAAVSEKFKEKAEADALAAACAGQSVTIKAVQRTEKTEKAPLLYDLTTLQREANRSLGYTAQQTLDYLQVLYEKKLCTYPRTDSRFLTGDLEPAVPELVTVAAAICETTVPECVNTKQVCDSRKVSDHHAILPTVSAGRADTSVLPLGEREILRLVAGQLLRAVSDAHRYAETTVTLECGGAVFTAKGRTTLTPGWKRYLTKEKQDAALPELSEGQVLECAEAAVKEGKTTPPKHYTEDTLLAAMETAGKEDMPEEAERKGLGTPATRAAIIEKLVATGFVERKRTKKAVSLVPAHTGVSLITVLPEQLQSPLLTAEWEYRLQQVERGELSPDEFMTGIADMLTELVKTYTVISGAEVLFPSGREIIGKCPRCGGEVSESKKGFFCERNDCRFGLWRDNRFFAAKHVALTKKIAAALLTDGRVKLTGLYSEKTGGTYDATVVLEDTGESVRFRLEFDKGART